ncbi:MAG: DNA repair protein RecN [Flavobacteriaceae bacterium]|nr:DNA repair protein RecN [Flavobacteriaceae bacterium]
MLQSLKIKNYALISQLSVDFRTGLSTLTGETGAGKSIILGALGLVLGKRAETSYLKNKEDKCIIEAEFCIGEYELNKFFDENDLDFEEKTLIRREILPSGKSRAFINDTPVNLSQLQGLGKKLVDIHSQHQTMEISESNFQFQILDSLAKNNKKVESYKRGLSIYSKVKKELKKLNEHKEGLSKEYEYNLFLYTELEEAKLKKGEQKDLEEKLELLNNTETIRENIGSCLSLGNQEEVGLIASLLTSKANIQKISSYSDKYSKIYDRLESVYIETTDIFNELEAENENIDFNPEDLEKLNDRLQLIYNLQKKHLVDSVELLIEKKEELSVKVDGVTNTDDQINKKQVELDKIKLRLDELSTTISANRKKTIPKLTKELEKHVSYLGMEEAKFNLELENTVEYFSNGKDKLSFLFSANKGGAFGKIEKVASGGELSRVMLAIKTTLSAYSKLPTIIFDEIDTGVSGEISNKIADVMAILSENMQVMAITHLPQIAAKGKDHFKVYKEIKGANTYTNLKLLNKEERVSEIAEMIEGKNPSESALAHARQLLN